MKYGKETSGPLDLGLKGKVAIVTGSSIGLGPGQGDGP